MGTRGKIVVVIHQLTHIIRHTTHGNITEEMGGKRREGKGRKGKGREGKESEVKGKEVKRR